jgi:signal transduction histidine kinase
VESLWIVHENGPVRAAIARRAGMTPTWAGTVAEAGAGLPADVAAPEVVILGVSGQIEEAFAAASTISREHPGARWILLHAGPEGAAVIGRRFAALAPTLLLWPPTSTKLQRVLQQRATAVPLASAVADGDQRETLVRRFTRSFEDLDLPNPNGSGSPLLIRAEPGSGRLLMARVIHMLAEDAGRFIHFACDSNDGVAPLVGRIEALGSDAGTICLEHPEGLSASAQRELRGWIELGLPDLDRDPTSLRFIGLVDENAEEALDPGLAEALTGLEIRIPPLRARPGAAVRIAEQWLEEWSHVHSAAARPLEDDARAAIEGDAWPGNLRELEATLRRAVSREPTGSIAAADLGASLLGSPSPRPASRPVSLATPATATHATPLEVKNPAPPGPDPRVPTFARALSHELRNPMVSLQTFAQLLPERGEDPTFQNEFRYQVERDLARIEDRLARLSEYSELRPAEATPVNVSALVETLLDERRNVITERHLLVLRELEDQRPEALGDPDRLRFAFTALLDAAFESVSDGADLYVACRHHPRGLDEGSAMRVLVRFHAEHPAAAMPGEAGELELALLLAREILEALGGRLTIDSTEADERVLLIDLPAPA